MPINLIDIQKKLEGFSSQANAYKAKTASRRDEMAELLRVYADSLEEVKARFDCAVEAVPRLRCAVPVDEPLDAVIPMGEAPKQYTVLAADGSQINPSRHTRVPFCVINIGVVMMTLGLGQAPEIFTQSELLDYEGVFTDSGGMISEGNVALMRDLAERSAMIGLADDIQHPAIAMIDGPLELIREPRESAGFSKILDQYLDILKGYRERDLAIVGYIDKSQSDLVGRLLELMALTDEDLDAYHQRERKFAGVQDLHLMSQMLQNPGERSAIFAIHSQTALQFRDDLALHFFYINVGNEGQPHLARVEVPQWVAADRDFMGMLQGVLTEQAKVLGTRPYPYLLHRAHEEALVTLSEHQHVEEMIVAEFKRWGIPVDEPSYKQYHKDLPTKKTRYQG
jgi:hypothetical protein